MKSLSSHFRSTQNFGEQLPVFYRPTMRSSAIFPFLFRRGKINSVYTFMGYWLRKRNIPEVTVLFTLRTAEGEKITVKSYSVKAANSYRISAFDLFEEDRLPDTFLGSVEIEIFSAVDMVFPYPAITFAIEGSNGITFVHTCGRVYNDIDDLNENSETQVPETGFDVLIGENYSPFFSFINGPLELKNSTYQLEFSDTYGNTLLVEREIKNTQPYSLVWEELSGRELKLSSLKGEKVTVKIHHQFSGFFPRFVAGNILKDYENLSLTHTYYDTSLLEVETNNIVNPDKTTLFDSLVALPLDSCFDKVELAIYPIFLTQPCNLYFQLFSARGELLEESSVTIEIANENDKLRYVNIRELFQNIATKHTNCMVRVVVDGSGVVPARMKFGLNLYKKFKGNNLPSNVCFNAEVPNTKILSKPGTFRWCPVFDGNNQKIFLHNASLRKDGFKDGNLKFELVREHDDKKLLWEGHIHDNGTYEVIKPKSKEISKFLDGSAGWLGIQSSNPYITGFYITDHGKGVIGADHLY